MALVDAAPLRAVQHPPNDRRAWLALGLAVLRAMSCVVALVLPYYAAGRPARESLYLYDIDALWPYTSAAGPLVGLLSFWALAMAPFISFAVVCWGAHRLWTLRAAPGREVVVAMALLVSVCTLGWFMTPMASDLLAWMID